MFTREKVTLNLHCNVHIYLLGNATLTAQYFRILL